MFFFFLLSLVVYFCLNYFVTHLIWLLGINLLYASSLLLVCFSQRIHNTLHFLILCIMMGFECNVWLWNIDDVYFMTYMMVQALMNFMKCILMTCCHYVIFRTYFDILIEFWGNMRWPGVLKARKLEELKATNRVTIFTTGTRFYHQRGMFFEPLKSWYNFWWRGTILKNCGAILWTVVRF